MNNTHKEYGKRFKVQPMTMHDASERANAPLQFLIPHLIPLGSTVLVIAPPDLDVTIFAHLLAYCVAAGKTFLPFGDATASSVIYFSSKRNMSADFRKFSLIRDRDPSPPKQEIALANMRLYNRHQDSKETFYLNSAYDQEAFTDAIPPDTGLVIFDNVQAWTKSAKAFDKLESSTAESVLTRLNAQGTAVLLFDTTGKKTNPITQAIVDNGSDNTLSITHDPGAPQEYGGGFNIVRSKRDDDDTTPRRFQFWWKVIEGKLDFGWEIRDQFDAKASKRMEMLERQMKVDQLLSDNKSQREIAILLEVDAATISRDVAKLKGLAADDNKPDPIE